MKIKLALISSIVLLTGCVASLPERVVTKGPLICQADEICPELSMLWNDEKRNGFKITAEINNPEQFNITQMNFIIDGQDYVYSTIQTTQFTKQETTTTSSNSIVVPVSFLNSFRDAKQIDLKIVTDKGNIERPILTTAGHKSSAYLTFLKGYAGDDVAQ